MSDNEMQNSKASELPEMATPDELLEVCQQALQYSTTKNYGQLDAFLEEAHQKFGQKVLLTNETFVLALIDSKLHRKEFREVYRLIEMSGRGTDVEKLTAIWHEAHYAEEELNIGRRLTPVMKYRVRARFPPPPNVHSPGRPVSLRLSRSCTAILKRWFTDHRAQMPTTENIENLARETNLTRNQVKNWFRRSIAKHKKENVEKTYHSNVAETFNLCLKSAATNMKNNGLSGAQVESPSKYLKKDDRKCSSPLANQNIQISDVLEFQDEDFIGFIPAYCVGNPTGNPTVMFDARSIDKKIRNLRSTDGAPASETDPAVTCKTVIQTGSASVQMNVDALTALQQM